MLSDEPELTREPPGPPNVSWKYTCRACPATLFRVAWYAAPRGLDDEPRPPGWAIECAGCGRVTLLPEAPDMTEVTSVPPPGDPPVPCCCGNEGCGRGR